MVGFPIKCARLANFRLTTVAVDASKLSSEERSKKGITVGMPRTFAAALATLYSAETNEPTEFAKAMGVEVVRRYKQVKEAERTMWEKQGTPEESETEQEALDRRKAWYMQRY